MVITLKFFASLREEIGMQEMQMELPEGTTAGELLALLKERFPQAPSLRHKLMSAVNRRYVDEGTVLQEGDEIAYLPPVGGGQPPYFRVGYEPLLVEEVLKLVETPQAGAVVIFVGTVRSNSLGREVIRLEYEAYPEMVEKTLAQIGEEVRERWRVERVAIHHRLGPLPVGQISVVIAIASGHREEAFAACRYSIDRIKEIAPIWKKEIYPNGEAWIH